MWLWIILAIVVVVVVLVLLFLRARSRRAGKMTSLVLFLKEPRQIDAQAVRRATTKAFGVRVGSTPDEENFVVQMSPEMMPVRINSLPLGFIYTAKPYLEQDPSEFKGMDARLVKVLTEHKAWCSLDLIADVPAAMKPEVYRHIGRLLSEFVDDNCLGVFCPENDLLMYNHPALKGELRGENPLAALEMKDVPVTQADYDEPALKATIDEAQKRWPEFVAAFKKRKPDQMFGVKLKFEESDETEFMWVQVQSTDGETIRGILDNAPMALKKVKAGDAVYAKRKDVLDWMYDEAGEMRGGFSLKVLGG